MAANEEPVLLISADLSLVVPASTAVFNVAQGSRGSIRRKNIGSHVLYKSGEIGEISSIDFVGVYGDSLFSKFLNFLTSTHRIHVSFGKGSIDILDIKKAVSDSLEKEVDLSESYFDLVPEKGEAIASLRDAVAAQDVFRALHIDSADGLLDVMS